MYISFLASPLMNYAFFAPLDEINAIRFQKLEYPLCIKYAFVLVQGLVNRNFQLVLNEMGPGQTSRAWYFHSPASGL